MQIQEIFRQFLQRYSLLNRETKVLLAVSGGIDSAVLCDLGRKAGLSFVIGHCNFGLRGGESDRDEQFVRRLGEKYSVPVFVERFDTTRYAQEEKCSIQEAARALRYGWFEKLRVENGLACTLLAHHANDNIETLLMNFFRGCGLDGLTGMPEENKGTHSLRPLLSVRRSEIETYAHENKLQWVEDSSNASEKYTRNFFRNNLLPQLQNVFPQVEENLLNNLVRMRQTQNLYNQLVAELKKKVCEPRGEEVYIPVLKLMKYKDTSLLYEIIRDYGFEENQVNELLKLAEALSGKYIANNRWRIIRHRAWFIVAPIAATAETVVIEKGDDLVRFAGGELRLQSSQNKNVSINTSLSVAQLDAREIQFPLLLRKWKKGDYFYPLGMRKKKKLARFFIDQKLSKVAKEKVWVLESHKRVVWVVGYRIDDRFKRTDTTRDLLQLTLSSPSYAGTS